MTPRYNALAAAFIVLAGLARVAPSLADEALPSLTEPGKTPPAERTPPYLPAPPPLPQGKAAPIFTAPATPPASPPPPPAAAAPAGPGPVTNYGTGGMQQMPGAPPNPPYPAGGLMH